MGTIYRTVLRDKKSSGPKTPTVITWNKVSMIASQSIRSVAKEIINMSENEEFIALNFIGKQGTGKTEIMRTLSHLIHEGSKLNYNINYFGKKEMLDLEETVKNLTPTNQILLMDDIAFISAEASKSQVDKIKSVIAVIRHLPGGKDVKIIMMKSFQYSKSIDPFLRQNDATFISSVDDNEVQNLEDLLGKKYHLKINLLKKMRVQAKIGDLGKAYFDYPLGRVKKLRYMAKNPFLPFLYSNQLTCRIVVSPLRTWIKPLCQICNPTISSEESNINIKQFINDFTKKFGGKTNAKLAIQIKLMQNGIDCFPPRIIQGVHYIDRFLAEKLINLEDLASSYNLTPSTARIPTNRKPEILN